jgi:hypothetical protein
MKKKQKNLPDYQPNRVILAGTLGQAGKKPYHPPKIRTEKVFEGNALACGKTKTQTSGCARNLKLS